MINTPNFVAVGSIFIDDIVYPDGKTQMGIMGGGGVHTGYGIKIWDETPGIITIVGENFPTNSLSQLQRDFDTRGLLSTDLPHVRAWQIFEWDHRRNEVFRVDVIEPFQIEPNPLEQSVAYSDMSAFALLRPAKDVTPWRQAFPSAIILWEPMRVYMLTGDRHEFVKTLTHIDIVSPNLFEAQTMYGIQNPNRLIESMLNDGAKIIALRMDEQGSLVASHSQPQIIHIPATPVPQVVDQTGAGNAYCGGFLVGLTRTKNLKEAGVYGAVSASFTLEQVGTIQVHPDIAKIRDERYTLTYEKVAE